jgi:ATP-dependent helicase HrpA
MVRENEVDLRLFKTKAEVEKHTPAAVRKLAETALSKDLAWLWKELRHLGSGASPKAAPLSGLAALSSLSAAPVKAAPDQLQKDAHEHIVRFALRLNPLLPLTQKRFTELCDKVRRELPALAHRVGDLMKQAQDWKQKLIASPKRYPGFDQDLARLMPANLIAVTPHEQLQHLPRYLRAMQVRAERASYAPDKDVTKADLIRDFDGWTQYVAVSQHETFRWMLEEYRVQVFAPELGTAQSVSPKKLEAMMV